MKRVQTHPCATCIFRDDGKAAPLRPGRLAEIQAYLIRGAPHDCHTNGRKTCRGSRDYQLTIWSRLGLIAEPTDQALAAAMLACGIPADDDTLKPGDAPADRARGGARRRG